MQFFKRYWIGTVFFLVVTGIFFAPLIPRVASSNTGGDAMFNAWTLSRNHNCILRQNCPDYADGNIFYPNEDSMLYSESQLSAGLLTLPLHFINENPNFAYNIWLIVSSFFTGWFMYLLAKRLSGGNELFSILAGLAFQFSPYMQVSLAHLQNLSIFYLPMIVLLMLKYLDRPRKKMLILLFLVLLLQFYASWYQMTFALITIGSLLGGLAITKKYKLKLLLPVFITVCVAVFFTLPLAKQYSSFSKKTSASYGVSEQLMYSSSLADYFIPYSNTLAGRAYHELRPGSKVNSFNPDSVSYHSFTLYASALIILVLSAMSYRKKSKIKLGDLPKTVFSFWVIAFSGFMISLGPLLKLKRDYTYVYTAGKGFDLEFIIPLPYLLFSFLAPNFSFIRAVGRSTVIMLFALCAIFALLPKFTNLIKNRAIKHSIVALIVIGFAVEIMPINPFYLSGNPHFNNLDIPKAYTYIRDSDEVDKIFVLATDVNYPGEQKPKSPGPPQAVFEQILWSGYHNKRIFNGYSGYFPKGYDARVEDFTDFKPDDVQKMKEIGLRYILLDKTMASSTPDIKNTLLRSSTSPVYEDSQHLLLRIR